MNDPARIWLQAAKRLRRKVNFARWLDQAAVPMVIAAGISAAAVLLTRHQWPDLTGPWLLATALALPLFTAGAMLLMARKAFIGVATALIRLEVHYGLHAALSTAQAGAGAWPEAPRELHDGLRWRWSRAGLPPVLAAALVCAAWKIPVEVAATPANKVVEPATWSVVEGDLNALVDKQVVDRQSTQQTRDAIEALRQRPKGEWFNHSSIEAGDRILQAHQRDMAGLENKMREAARALRQAAKPLNGPNTQPPSDLGGLEKVLEELRAGGLKPDASLMEQLSKLSGASSLAELDPRQLAELLDQLNQNAQQLSEMLEQFQGMPAPGEGQDGLAQGDGQGEGDQPGQGAPNRGPGEGGELFGKSKDGLNPELNKPLPTGDLSRAAPGDLAGISNARHEVDPKSAPTVGSGGAPTQAGDGGGAVWSDTLLPNEQEALRRFFE